MKKEIIKGFDVGVIYFIANDIRVCLVQCMPKKGAMTADLNENNELIPMLPVTEWRVCMDYQKMNAWTEKENFAMPLMDQ